MAMTLRVTVARSARRERKLWTGRPSSVQRLRALRWAASERSALATTEGRAASAAALCAADMSAGKSRVAKEPGTRGRVHLGGLGSIRWAEESEPYRLILSPADPRCSGCRG